MKRTGALFLALCIVAARVPAFAESVDALLPGLGSEKPGDLDKAQKALFNLCAKASRPGAEEERAAMCQAVAKALPNASPAARPWLLRQLERIGKAECVEAVAAQLNDKDEVVRDCARRALERNPAPEAGQALAKALPAADKPAYRVGLLNSLGARESSDPVIVQALLKEVTSSDDEIRSAAVYALGRSGDKTGAKAVAATMKQGSPRAQAIATDAYLLLGDRLCEKGDKASALPIYKELYAGTGHVKCAALIGLGRAGGVAELNTIFEAMGDPDVKLRGAALTAVCLLSSKEATQALMAKLKDAPKDMKLIILRALSSASDKSVVPALVQAAGDADEDVRTEALRGLGLVGDASAVLPLAKGAASGGKARDAAREGLDRLAGKDVDEALVATLKDTDPKVRAEVARSLGARRTVAAAPALLKAGEDADAAVRAEALKALVALATAEHVPALSALLAKAQDPGERDAGVGAVVAAARQITDEAKRGDAAAAVYANATAQGKQGLLTALGRLGGAKALETCRAATKDADEEVRKAAVRGLGEWPDASSAPDLLGLIKSAPNETMQVLALRGYIRLGGLARDVAMFKTALESAKRTDEKKLALSGLGEVKDVAALNLLDPYVEDPALKEEAGAAAVSIGRDIGRRQAEAVRSILQKVVGAVKSNDTRRQAQDVLNGLPKKK
jgi:HEAT repeat protein